MAVRWRRQTLSIAATLVCCTAFGPSECRAQAPTIELNEAVVGPSSRTPGAMESRLGATPGVGADIFGMQPGRDDPILGGRIGPSVPRVPANITDPGAQGGPRILPRGNLAPIPSPAPLAPLYGTLSMPSESADDGPADGLSLDRAIDRLIHYNLALQSKSFEIPQARADLLTASLRANPLFYADSQLIPYDQYSGERPGGPTQYDVNISHPIDYSRKRQARMLVAGRALRVIEAQYQDAVRLEINSLYTLFVDVLAARQTLRYAQASVIGLEELLRATSRLKEMAAGTSPEVRRIRGQLEMARIGVEESEELLRRSRRALAVILNLPADEAERLEVRGMIEDRGPDPPSDSELMEAALKHRPDVVSFELGVRLAEANHKLMRANRYSDAYLLYQPYTYQNNAPFGKQSATSWALGLTVPLPIYNRNQGNIERARLNITQSQIDLAGLQRQVAAEVQQALGEYRTSGRTARAIHDVLVPEARRAAADKFQLFMSGEVDVTAFLDTQRAYNDVVKQYLDTAIRHRRSMLTLNTAVGRRIMP